MNTRPRQVSNPAPALSALSAAFLTGAGVMALITYGWSDIIAWWAL